MGQRPYIYGMGYGPYPYTFKTTVPATMLEAKTTTHPQGQMPRFSDPSSADMPSWAPAEVCISKALTSGSLEPYFMDTVYYRPYRFLYISPTQGYDLISWP